MTTINPLIPVVVLATAELDETELLSLSMCVTLGSDARTKEWYDKVRSLFTEDGGARMHQTTKEALAVVVTKRLRG